MTRKRRVIITVTAACIFAALAYIVVRTQNERPDANAVTSERATAYVVPEAPSALPGRNDAQDEYRTEITFFGKVVDQQGRAIAGAQVMLRIVGQAEKEGAGERTVATGEDGRFTLSNERGAMLAVEVSKEGYRRVPPDQKQLGISSKVFWYGMPGSEAIHKPQSESPVVFTLYKREPSEPTARVGERTFKVAPNGDPTRISLDNKGGYVVEVRSHVGRRDPTGVEKRFDWSLDISVENGRLQIRENPLSFAAPASGYKDDDKTEMKAGFPRNLWRGFLERSYFIKFSDGSVARADIEFRPRSGFIVWESIFNLTPGSYNLESEE